MKVAVIVLADPTQSPRPRRLLQLLRDDGHEAVSIGTRNSDRDLGMKRIRTHLVANAVRYLLRRYETLAHSFIPTGTTEYLQEQAPDIVVLHDVRLLPWLAGLNGSWRIVVDLQEYYPGMLDTWTWRLSMGALYRHILSHYGSVVDAWWTVSPHLQALYREQHGISPELVPNATPYHDLQPSRVMAPFRAVHHGYALPDRNLEQMIKAVEACNGRILLDLILLYEPAWPRYWKRLERMVERSAYVNLREPGSWEGIVESKQEYDLGLYPLAPSNQNMAGALPNKFYDFIQARLCLVTGPSGEMAEQVRRMGIGVNAQGTDARSIKEALLSLDAATITTAKAHSHRRAYDQSYGFLCAPVIRRTLGALT